MAVPNVPHATFDDFKNAVNGNGYDMDGQFGYQCWDGVDLLYQQSDVGQYLYTAYNVGQGDGTAKSCWINADCRQRNGSGHFTAVTGKENIKIGDIVVFNTYSGWYGNAGHIGFATTAYDGSDYIYILSQNYGTGSNPTTGKPFNIAQAFIGDDAFLGIFRYDAWNTTPPEPETETKKVGFPWAIALQNWY